MAAATSRPGKIQQILHHTLKLFRDQRMDKANSVTDNGFSSLGMAYSTMSSSRPPYQNPSVVTKVRSSIDGAMTTAQMAEHTMCDVAQ